MTKLSSSLSSTAPRLFEELVGDNTSSLGVDGTEAGGTLVVAGVDILNGFEAGDFCFEDLFCFLVVASEVDLRLVEFFEVFVIETLDVDLGVVDVKSEVIRQIV